jgi:hypothetical protein
MSDSTLKPELLQRYAGNRRIFCETGTARGEGLQAALDWGRFEELYSIEANVDAFTQASSRFAACRQVELLLGDAGKVLPQLLRTIREPCVFWLDSHWSTGEAPLPPGYSPCPLLAELRALAEHPVKDHVILIDDIRYFWQGIPQWGNIHVGQIVQMLLEVNPLGWLRFEHGVTPGDILVLTPTPGERPVRQAVEEYERHVR